MREQIAVQEILRRKLFEFQGRNPKFSVRAFAQRLGLSSAATNEILKGQRRVSRKMAERLAVKLLLNPTERHEILRHFPDKRENKPNLPLTSLQLSSDQFNVVSHWIHFAILSLVKLPSFQSDVEWISRRLAVKPSEAQDAIDRLIRVGLLKRTASGALKRAVQHISTTDDVSDTAIRKSHLADLELARTSLLNDPVELRDFSSFTLPVSLKLLPKAKELIRKAQDDIAELLSSQPATEVYRLSVQLFPLTQIEKNRTLEKPK